MASARGYDSARPVPYDSSLWAPGEATRGARTAPLLSVQNLHVHFPTRFGVVRALNGISFDLQEGEALALVGESGCGKSVTALSLLRLLPSPGRIVSGHIWWQGSDLATAPERGMRGVRGKEIAMVFQDPMTSLNPVLTVGQLIGELLRLDGLDGESVRQRCLELLEIVRIPAPARIATSYAHQLSGGMRQRVIIAMAISRQPKLLVADEPTTALDVTIQAQILDLLRSLQKQFRMSLIIISHNFGVVSGISDRIAVMYGGHILEIGPSANILRAPRHPYSLGLLECVPRLGQKPKARLQTIEGAPPDPTAITAGCPFWPRCTYRRNPRCEVEPPILRGVGDQHLVACLYDV